MSRAPVLSGPVMSPALSGANSLDGWEATSRLQAFNAQAMTSGGIRLVYGSATQARTVTSGSVMTATTAAATTTLIRYGLYTVAANGDLTLVASTPNDITLCAATNTEYSKALSAAYTTVPGQRYASAFLFVGTTPPSLFGISSLASVLARAPRLSGLVTGQTDLPASIAAGSVAATSSVPWIGFV